MSFDSQRSFALVSRHTGATDATRALEESMVDHNVQRGRWHERELRAQELAPAGKNFRVVGFDGFRAGFGGFCGCFQDF
jgi:hypothetical protein